MSEKKRVKYPFTTERGTAIYPKLDKPDTKFAPEGTYGLRLKLSGEAADKLIADISRYADQQLEASRKELTEKKKHAEAKKLRITDLPFKPEYDGDGNETGATLFSFKMKASGTKADGKQWNRRPALFDAKGKPIAGGKIPPVGGGSIVKVSGDYEPYCNPKGEVGVSARLEAVQIIELKTFADRDAAQYGFGAEEGYEQDDASAASSGFTDETPTSNEPANGDF